MKFDLSKILNIISLVTALGMAIGWYTDHRIQVQKDKLKIEEIDQDIISITEALILIQEFTDEQNTKNTEYTERIAAIRERLSRLEE